MAKVSRTKKDAEEAFLEQVREAGLPEPEREYRFHPTRKWRFDFAWPEIKVAVEIEGSVWARGRHTRGSGYLGDIEKYNEATALGWRVYRVPAHDVESGAGIYYVSKEYEHYEEMAAGRAGLL